MSARGLARIKDESGRRLYCIARWRHVWNVSQKLCRHCGGALPCWSMFGDYAPGKSYRAADKGRD